MRFDKISDPVELSEAQFEKITRLCRRLVGIDLHLGKEELIKARLTKRLRALRMDSFDQYITYLEHDKTGQEVNHMIDALTTNMTRFYRGSDQFEYLGRQILPRLKGPRIRMWSAGCSSGEEPYSIALILREELPDVERRDVRILATDISTNMLTTAQRAIYDEKRLEGVRPRLIRRYFTCVRDRHPREYRVDDAVRAMIWLARLNLVGPWPMQGPFNVIFCCNVMIYFGEETRQRLVQRFWELLEPEGHLFVGASESLTGILHEFHYVQPTIYRK